jgi:hypothetical protein
VLWAGMQWVRLGGLLYGCGLVGGRGESDFG